MSQIDTEKERARKGDREKDRKDESEERFVREIPAVSVLMGAWGNVDTCILHSELRQGVKGCIKNTFCTVRR